MKIQQEILARRKNKSGMKQYFNSVEERRKEIAKTVSKTDWRQEKEDPLNKWRTSLEKGEVKKIGYEPEPSKSDSLFGVNIIVPINPIGIPKYDQGERFDLRLPYAEVSILNLSAYSIFISNDFHAFLQRGYEDPDADVIGKLGQGISNLFGFGKKKSDEKQDKKSK